MRPNISAFISGLIFAIGLGISGMTDPANVLGFLDITGDWDFRLAFVMGGAIAVHAALRPLIHKRARPLFAAQFPVITASKLDPKLLAGSALFGVGWGLGGYCPGPALTSLASGAQQLFVFVPAMLVGMYLAQVVQARRSASAPTPSLSATPQP
ncbi:MAG: YeeE/YedE family protein [Myxococcaceae bacterium]|nr:YeeE/YedE family protein [Myxococcaceae bacterium]